MIIFYKIISLFTLFQIALSHGVSQSTVEAMTSASLWDYVYFGAEHMVTGYDHILFLIGVLFFLTNYLDIFRFITAFTVAHCITLVFATFYGITANAFLIDAVIAFSVIYKGFENLGGFQKWFSKSPPNLIIMVFIFGLIHGFGLSTKLQEIALLNHIDLSLYQILSFNVGVELGQIIVLLIVFPALSMLRGESFNKISKISNRGLVIAGIYLFIFQLNSYFQEDFHNHNHNEINNHKEVHEHHQKESNKHSHGGEEHTH